MSQLVRCGATSLLLLSGPAPAQITPGNLIVVRVGDGALPLVSGLSARVFLDQYDRMTPGGALGSIAMPTAPSGANLPITNSGLATSEGFITQSSDGRYFVTTGYAAAPGIPSVVSTTASMTPRVVARIALDGTVDTSTSINNSLFSGAHIHSACTEDGSRFWAVGYVPSVVHVTHAATTGTLLNTLGPTDLRCVAVANGQLYTTSGAGTPTRCINAVGTGVPTTGGQTLAILNGMGSGTASPCDHWFADPQTVYVADERTAACGGIQKWSESAGTWTLQYTLAPALNVGCRGLSGIRDLSGTTIWATTTDNRLVSALDTGIGSTFTTLATAASNTAFRGVRFVRTPYDISFTGTGCPVATGVPTIGTVNGAPISGNGAFGLSVGNTPPVSLFLSVVSIGTPLTPGVPLFPLGTPACTMLYPATLDIVTAGLTDGGGMGITPLPLGVPDAALWGLDLGTQHLVFDPVTYPTFGLPLGASVGMQLVIGS